MFPLGSDLDGQQFRGGLVLKAHRLCVSLNSRLERNNEEKKDLELSPSADVGLGSEAIIMSVQGYLAEKPPPRRILQEGYA